MNIIISIIIIAAIVLCCAVLLRIFANYDKAPSSPSGNKKTIDLQQGKRGRKQDKWDIIARSPEQDEIKIGQVRPTLKQTSNGVIIDFTMGNGKDEVVESQSDDDYGLVIPVENEEDRATAQFLALLPTIDNMQFRKAIADVLLGRGCINKEQFNRIIDLGSETDDEGNDSTENPKPPVTPANPELSDDGVEYQTDDEEV